MITANLVNGTNNFLPQGNLTELIAGDSTPSPVLAATSAPLTAQVNSMTHRYAFGTAGYLEVCSTDCYSWHLTNYTNAKSAQICACSPSNESSLHMQVAYPEIAGHQA